MTWRAIFISPYVEENDDAFTTPFPAPLSVYTTPQELSSEDEGNSRPASPLKLFNQVGPGSYGPYNRHSIPLLIPREHLSNTRLLPL
jgi:hypothetical protein